MLLGAQSTLAHGTPSTPPKDLFARFVFGKVALGSMRSSCSIFSMPVTPLRGVARNLLRGAKEGVWGWKSRGRAPVGAWGKKPETC